MKNTKLSLLTAALALATAFTLSCSGDGGGGNPIKKAKITGVSQKGPFVKGSSATLYELNEEFAQTGRSFRDIIADDYGKFEIKNVELASPYAMLEADGFYRNEVTGQTSKAPIKLYAIADIREKDNVNVNLLTHLEYYRVLNLAENGKTVAEAKKQAQKEILAVFGINGDFENSEDMSIFGTTEGDAALLAISVLLQGDLSEGDFSQRLTDFAQDLKASGTWGNEGAKAAIADWASSFANLARIKNNILGWGLSSEVPDFGEYVTDYWTVAYSLGGCGSENSGEVKKDNRNVYRICKNGNWMMASALEYDTYQWVCLDENEGEIKVGDVNYVLYYVCENKDWREATIYERDIYGWQDCSDANARELKIGNSSGNYYICKNNAWENESNPKYKDIYCLINSCQYFVDSHDNQRYSYVTIGEHTWMAENLNYNAEGSLCQSNNSANCDKYGKLYSWLTAMNIASGCYPDTCSGQIQFPHRGICPDGWHIPNNAEWDNLFQYADADNGNHENPYEKNGTAGKYLKSTDGWYSYDVFGNGTDKYGFSALPYCGYYSDNPFGDVGYSSGWWSASEDYEFNPGFNSYELSLSFNEDVVGINSSDKANTFFYVRCVKD